jgi:cyclopropane-fatty-acyl-phospholipid synthase
MFRSPRGQTHLFQIVFSKGNITQRNYPMSRAFLYQDVRAAAPARERPVAETA